MQARATARRHGLLCQQDCAQEVLPALLTVLTKAHRIVAQHLLLPEDRASRQHAAGVRPISVHLLLPVRSPAVVVHYIVAQNLLLPEDRASRQHAAGAGRNL